MKIEVKKHTPSTNPEEFTSKYKKIFLKIILAKQKPVLQRDVVDECWKQVNKGKDEGTPGYVQRETVQSSSSKYLKELVVEGHIMLCDDRHYVAYNRKNERKKLITQLENEIQYDAKAPFEVSNCVLAVKVQRKSEKVAADLFEAYYREWCYGVIPVHGMVLILLTCNDEQKEHIRKELAKIMRSDQKANASQ